MASTSTKRIILPTLLLAMVLVLGLSSGCTKDKLVDKAEDFVIFLIVDNNWIVTNFTEGGANITAQFSGYEYDFHRDWKVTAIKSGQLEVNGTWSANSSAQTITSNFPQGIDLLQKFNGTWNIDKTTMASVDASRTTNGVAYQLSLRKK